MKIFSLVYVVICGVLMLVYEPVIGGCVLAAAALEYLYYYKMSQKEFGGITGDLAGFHMQLLRAGDRFRGSDRREIMRLVIGGAFQGKKDYVKIPFIWKMVKCRMEPVLLMRTFFSCPCLYHIHQWIRKGLEENWDLEDLEPGSWKEIPISS